MWPSAGTKRFVRQIWRRGRGGLRNKDFTSSDIRLLRRYNPHHITRTDSVLQAFVYYTCGAQRRGGNKNMLTSKSTQKSRKWWLSWEKRVHQSCEFCKQLHGRFLLERCLCVCVCVGGVESVLVVKGVCEAAGHGQARWTERLFGMSFYLSRERASLLGTAHSLVCRSWQDGHGHRVRRERRKQGF